VHSSFFRRPWSRFRLDSASVAIKEPVECIIQQLALAVRLQAQDHKSLLAGLQVMAVDNWCAMAAEQRDDAVDQPLNDGVPRPQVMQRQARSRPRPWPNARSIAYLRRAGSAHQV
jgi:hypothetical protein